MLQRQLKQCYTALAQPYGSFLINLSATSQGVWKHIDSGEMYAPLELCTQTTFSQSH